MDSRLQRFAQYSTSRFAISNDDVWLACYPKAGSTWLRFIICNLIALEEMDGREVDFHLVAELSPSFGRSSLLKKPPYKSLPRIIKTHQPYRKLLFGSPNRTIYILRDPRDVMVSRYHYRQASMKNPYRGEFSTFIRDSKFGLETFFEHFWSWHPFVTVFLQYEKMKRDPHNETSQMFRGLGVNVSDDQLQEAINRSTLEKMRGIQAKSGLAHPGVLNPEYMFARKGKSKQWIDYFSTEDIAYYKALREKHNYTLYSADA